MSSWLPRKTDKGLIRLATPEDIPGMAGIYFPYILNSSITFETEVPDEESFRNRILGLMAGHPVLIYEAPDGSVAGYAYAGKYRDRKAYQWCVESSVYLEKQYWGTGMAAELYTTLENVCRHAGFTRIYAVITLPNERSERFHQKLGYLRFTTFEKTGFKFNTWWDVAWYEKVLDDSGAPPKDILPPDRY